MFLLLPSLPNGRITGNGTTVHLYGTQEQTQCFVHAQSAFYKLSYTSNSTPVLSNSSRFIYALFIAYIYWELLLFLLILMLSWELNTGTQKHQVSTLSVSYFLSPLCPFTKFLACILHLLFPAHFFSWLLLTPVNINVS